jgi:hypothetical protein
VELASDAGCRLTLGDPISDGRLPIHMDFLCRGRDIGRAFQPASLPDFASGPCIGVWEIRMSDLVDIAIPANAQAIAESLGLVVSRSVTDGVRVRRIMRDEAEIAVACLHDYGVAARIIDINPPSGPQLTRDTPKAA